MYCFYNFVFIDYTQYHVNIFVQVKLDLTVRKRTCLTFSFFCQLGYKQQNGKMYEKIQMVSVVVYEYWTNYDITILLQVEEKRVITVILLFFFAKFVQIVLFQEKFF
ncbi:hypothetical protein CHS0354_033908 [Potamilus streckersoni]|uniref:Transmembrane protein n=1 Tax=Potamilus streckersoni TaxID=2493646 RepID=A0AAE0VLI1_9BIVA|nr:hypothetical protein CHS0354_033908 [Potamilus streckersoni]